MQKRLSEVLQELEENIQIIKDNYDEDDALWPIEYTKINIMLDKLLSSPDKSFEVIFKGKKYSFIYPTTKEEAFEMAGLRQTFISTVFKECWDQMRYGNDTWWMITAFASGIDTLDMQIEIVKEEIVNRVDENGERITALPLDMDNYQIKQEMNDGK